MKKIALFFALLLAFSCGSSKSTSEGPSNLQADLDKKNRMVVPLLTRIRQQPGVVLKNGRPALLSTYNNFSTFTQEPLYVLNEQIIGSSFTSIDNLVENFMVKKIEIISGPDASFYGSRGANGVIKITTFSGKDDKTVTEN
ncbi:MAG: hypothetical protein AAGC45_05815 [Bacteroidota bacterium]